MLLVLLLAQNGASAAVSGLFSPSHKGTVLPSGHSDQHKTLAKEGGGDYGGCGNFSCGASGEAADIVDWIGLADGFADFSQFGSGGGGLPSPGHESGPHGLEFAGGPFFGFGSPGGPSDFPGGFGDGPTGNDLPGMDNPAGNPDGNPGGGKPGTGSPDDPGSGGFEGPSGLDALYVPPIGDGTDGGALPGGGSDDPPVISLTDAPPAVTVPEPLTAPLFAAGLLLLARRRKHRAS